MRTVDPKSGKVISEYATVRNGTIVSTWV